MARTDVEPSGGTVACDTESMRFTFRGAIVANGAGEVRYRWIRIGAIGPNDSGTVASEGTLVSSWLAARRCQWAVPVLPTEVVRG